MDVADFPAIWQAAFERDALGQPSAPDPLPERRLARLLAAFIASGLFFMVAPGTLLGVWNLLNISSHARLGSVSAAWIQAHGHAQLFGWVGTFMVGISLYTLPKFRGSLCRSIPIGWAMWAMWTAGVALRWVAGVQSRPVALLFRSSAGLELAVALLLIWQCAGNPKRKPVQGWELPVFAGLAGLAALLAWQMFLVLAPLNTPALPPFQDRILISLALWAFCLPVVLGYCAKFFPGLLGTAPLQRNGMRAAIALLAAAAAAYALDAAGLAAAGSIAAGAAAGWSLRVFHRTAGKPKTNGVDPRYPLFARLAYGWLAVAAVLGAGAVRPGFLGASRHAFTVGFLGTLIFAIGPRILPSFLNSRELWSPRLMRWALVLLTAGCALRVGCQPLAYGQLLPAAWKILPISALTECVAVLLFALNLLRSMAAPVPSWFGHQHVNDRMCIYWLISSYPGTRQLLQENGLLTLQHARRVPRSLTLREAAEADGVPSPLLVERLGRFFDARLAPSLRKSGD